MAAGDITKAEVRADVTKWEIKSVYLSAEDAVAKIVYNKKDAGGSTVDKKSVIFRNIADNPETPKDETSNEFTQLINLINSGNNIKTSIATAVKTKLKI